MMKKDMFYVVTGGWDGYDYKELCEIINKKDYGYIGEFESEAEAMKVLYHYRENIIYDDDTIYIVHNNTYIEK